MELQKRKEKNNGTLSAQDFNEVYNIVAKDVKTRGYYDDKYWSQIQVSNGVAFLPETDEERMYKEKVNVQEREVQHMSGVMKHWLAIMSKRFPGEDFISEMEARLHVDEVSIYWTIYPSLSLT